MWNTLKILLKQYYGSVMYACANKSWRKFKLRCFGLLQGEQPKQFFGSRNFLALIFSHDAVWSLKCFKWLVIFLMFGNNTSKHLILQTHASLFEALSACVLPHSVVRERKLLRNMKHMCVNHIRKKRKDLSVFLSIVFLFPHFGWRWNKEQIAEKRIIIVVRCAI